MQTEAKYQGEKLSSRVLVNSVLRSCCCFDHLMHGCTDRSVVPMMANLQENDWMGVLPLKSLQLCRFRPHGGTWSVSTLMGKRAITASSLVALTKSCTYAPSVCVQSLISVITMTAFCYFCNISVVEMHFDDADQRVIEHWKFVLVVILSDVFCTMSCLTLCDD